MLLLAVPVLAGDDVPVFVHAYRDFRQYLYVFENGVPRILEQQPVRMFKVRGPLVAYANNGNNLMVYYKGEKFNLGDMTATTFEVTQSFMYYQREQALTVFSKGQTIPLTYFIRDFRVSDSLLVFRDRNVDMLRVFRNGEVQELETTLTGSLRDFKVGENTVAYSNQAGFFKIFYGGETFEIDNVVPLSYEPGGNLVAFVDGLYNYLKVFYRGKILVLEKLQPQSYKCGTDLVAYLADDNTFKVFSNGKLVRAEAYAPDFYYVRDNTVLFYINNRLQALVNGVRYELDEFLPQNYQLSENNIAWIDVSGRLHVFTEGKSYEVSMEKISTYDLNGNTLRYDLPDGSSKIWYKGKSN